MLDIHLMHILSNGVKYYKSSRDLFDPLFYTFADSMKARIFAELNRQPISFDTAFQNRKSGGLPLITVENSEQVFPNQSLADASGMAEDGFGRLVRWSHIFTSQTAAINVYTDSMELTRALQIICRSSILLYTPQLLRAGYENLLYQGSSAVYVEAQLYEGGSAAYATTLTYSALHHHMIPVYQDNIDTIGTPPAEYLIDVHVPTLKA